MAEFISIPMGASRVCKAISKIGYSPASSIMDIIDNSITANANRVIVEIETHPDMTYNSKNNVLVYRILDNGEGMTDDEILNALKLGSDAHYGTDSLSKYGMGLKSAGLSLGTRIQVISKKDGVFSNVSYIDVDIIADENDYGLCREEITEAQQTEFNEKLENPDSGTIIEISGCQSIEQASASNTINNLQERLGVVYYEFLRNDTNPLSIKIRCTDKPEIEVQPHDILFKSDALPEFDEDSYDYKLPCLVLDTELPISEEGAIRPIGIEVVIFPRHQMSNYPGFSQEERDKIKEFKVSRKNKGFYIYRNKRLIRWGDDLINKDRVNLVGKDDYGFRCRIKLHTEHDDFLHVDVSKQRVEIPEDIIQKIETIIRNPLRVSRRVFELCSQQLNLQGESEVFNERNQALEAEDFDEPTGEGNITVTRERRRRLVEDTARRLTEDGEPEPEQPEVVEELPLFQKIRYSERVSSTNLWESGFHHSDGDFVRVNTNHPFYRTVLCNLPPASPERQAFEAILWSCAAAENRANTNLAELPQETIQRVIDRFKRVVGNTLDSWCSNNQDLFA